MKKIQITTVQKTANVEVIELNSSFVAKAVRAADTATKLRNLIDKTVPQKPVLDDHGEPFTEAGTGIIITEPDYTNSCKIEIEPEEIIGKLCQFVHELEDAMLVE
jgi:hypothetical protein